MTEVNVDSDEAELIIESLRKGVPPAGHLQEFTVGRRDQIAQLAATIKGGDSSIPASLLIQANYGAGKTHLLRLIREIALERNFAVALVTVDSRSGVRFNRMDQICSAVMREIEVPRRPGKGVNVLFDHYFENEKDDLVLQVQYEIDKDDSMLQVQKKRSIISNDGKWSRRRGLQSDPLWIALRAWKYSQHREARDIVKSWLSSTDEFESRRKYLYLSLVMGLPMTIRNAQSEAEMYRSGAFSFKNSGYQNSWNALEDLHVLAQLAGLQGLVLLFDEFEDVIQNIKRIDYQRSAFLNLITLMGGEQFSGWKYFAVTPEFISKCQRRLVEKFQYDFPEEEFDELERIEMIPVGESDFLELAKRIRAIHGVAYDWDAENQFSNRELQDCVKGLYSRTSTDQVRMAMTGLVEALDSAQGN